MAKAWMAGALACVLLLAPGAVAEEGATPEQRLMAEKADAIVSLKYVLNVHLELPGRGPLDREVSANATGVVVDKSGLVMIPASALDGLRFLGIPPQFLAMANGQSTPSNVRVIFPGDEKEYPAILGAKDSRLGLAFMLIKDLGDKKPAVADLSNAADPAIGQTLYGVSRLGQGFDHAPFCNTVKVIGKVKKPRSLWALDAARGFLSQPLYTASGAVAGICVSQEGVGGGGTRPFVLPLAVAKPTVAAALKDANRALDEILEAEEEAAAEAADEQPAAGDGEKPPADGDGEKPPADAPKAPDAPGGGG